MQNIIDGFLHFKQHVFPQKRQLFRRLGTGQHPQALFITCADSRVVPELITQTAPGDLFVCRTVGNQVPVHGSPAEGGVASAVEYALEALNIHDIVVCGHSDCGAMKAVLHPEKMLTLPSTSSWLRHAEAARSVVMKSHQDASDEVLLHRLTEENILAQMRNLTTHLSVASRLKRGDVKLHGWLYHIHSGEITAYDESTRSFRSLEGSPALSTQTEAQSVLTGGAA